MKKYLLSIFAIFTFLLANAQNGQHSEKIQALKIAFITQRLELTSAEAEKFWPVYNEYEVEINNLRISNKTGDVLDNEQKLLDIKKKYSPRFEKILGPQKLNKFFIAEKEFRNVLIKRLKTQRQQRLQ
ncbi:MAG: hypothetical protein ABI325_12035 [Ginsengibacter sp.]